MRLGIDRGDMKENREREGNLILESSKEKYDEGFEEILKRFR